MKKILLLFPLMISSILAYENINIPSEFSKYLFYNKDVKHKIIKQKISNNEYIDNIVINIKDNKRYVENTRSMLNVIEKLIKKRKLLAAQQLFLNVNLDISTKDKLEYYNFFKMAVSLDKNNIVIPDVSKISEYKTKELWKIFTEYFFTGKIQDKNYVEKMIEFVNKSNLETDDKLRMKSKLYYLSGNYVACIQLLNSIKEKNKDDIIFLNSIYNILRQIQEVYIKDILKTDHKNIELLNLEKMKLKLKK